MKVCLISPPWVIRKRSNIWNYVRGTMPPLGILYLASYIEKHTDDIQVDVVDFVPRLFTWEAIEEKIKTLDYDVFGITGTTSIISHAYRIADMVKKHHPESTVVFGGIHATSLPEEGLEKESIDFVIRGEGEVAFYELLTGKPYNKIIGLSYKDENGYHHTGPAAFVKDIEEIPSPAFEKLDLKIYKPAIGAYKRLPAINMMALRGCVGKCTFCNSADIAQRKRSAQHIYEEMAMLSREFGIKEITFYDDTFTVYRSNVIELCRLLIENNIDLTWSCFARTDCVTEDMLSYMKKAGCHQVLFGIETASDEVAKNIRKPIRKEKNLQAIQWAQKVGLNVRASFMIGNPGDNPETIEETISYAIELDPDLAMFNISTPFPGTQLFDWAKEKGYLRTENWDEYDFSEPILQLPGLSSEFLLKKNKEGYRRFYMRPKFFFKKFRRVAHFRDFSLLTEGFRAVSNFLTSKEVKSESAC